MKFFWSYETSIRRLFGKIMGIFQYLYYLNDFNPEHHQQVWQKQISIKILRAISHHRKHVHTATDLNDYYRPFIGNCGNFVIVLCPKTVLYECVLHLTPS